MSKLKFLLKFSTLLGILAIVWVGMIDTFLKHGAMAGVLALILVVALDRHLSKVAITMIRENRKQDFRPLRG